MFWLKLVKNFLQILRSGQTPRQVAGGFALGAVVGLMPFMTLQGVALWFIILIFDVNLSAALLAATLFSLIAYLFDPLLHALGFYLLVEVTPLHALWTALYNAPVAPLTRFNNTIVMGSFVGSLILALPLYFGMRRFVVAYRDHIGTRVEQWRVYQLVSKSLLVRWYTKIKNLGT